MRPGRSAKISIDLAALEHNFQLVRKASPSSKIMPAIKANAYGHGQLQIAESLKEADGFAVAQFAEAMALRNAGFEKPITVFQGFSNEQQLSQMQQHRIRPAISQLWQLDLLQARRDHTPLDVWLKINTGMGRLGVQPDQAAQCWNKIQNIKYIQNTGLMMHFSNADAPSHRSNQQQINTFQQLLDKLSVDEVSVSNSAAILTGLYKFQASEYQAWVRPGIMLYGASPLPNRSADELGLKAVMSLQAELIAINPLARGHPVGYGGDWICPENMPVGIVNIGYADGYPRHALSGTPVVVNGQQTQLIGRVSMDSIAIDLREMDVRCGDAVELWGSQVGVDEVARNAGTIAYELLCNAGRLVGVVPVPVS
ncbi:Alanine racemase [hydrothermal vent metagenome]|uniref:Alanine racemase n=1 Tax=hydrothermal vent metagenome TaxID=652676 RepID=A0A3B0XB22_9ZZZZ